jgi:hypothetical protein
MALRDLHTNPEVLECAVVDGINRFVRDILKPRGVLNEDACDGDLASVFDQMKYQIAKEVALRWEHCQIDDAAG